MNQIIKIENEIDDIFSSNQLLESGYAQSMWTVLSVLEDHNLRMRQILKLDNQQLNAYVDTFINIATYPLRACLRNSNMDQVKLKRNLIPEHYTLAKDWLDKANEYRSFCSIFPMYHKKLLDLKIVGNEIQTKNWKEFDFRYEAYNRIRIKTGNVRDEVIDPNELVNDILPNIKFTSDSFLLKLNPKLAEKIIAFMYGFYAKRFELPEYWQFSSFSIKDFRNVFISIQAILYAWYISRVIAVQKEVINYGYNSSVWVINKSELINRIARYTRIDSQIVKSILHYLTFGEMGIRMPDIATQPIIDLRNDSYAMSSFILDNVDSERNLCVLLNQIEKERVIYSKLVDDKEQLLQLEIKDELKDLGYDFRSGKFEKTNIDIAIIDRINKVCLSIEIKWFIEPAEIREIYEKTLELKRGIEQCHIIIDSFNNGNKKLIDDILGIDKSYSFFQVVGSKNWIGHFNAQDPIIPIIKLGHLLEEIKKRKSLTEIVDWLMRREYLPIPDKDFHIIDEKISIGPYFSTWYSIK